CGTATAPRLMAGRCVYHTSSATQSGAKSGSVGSMETSKDREERFCRAFEAFFTSISPEIAPGDPKEAVVEPYSVPKEPIYPPNPALTAGMALPTPQRSVLEAFFEEIWPSGHFTPPMYAPPNTPRAPRAHPPRWNSPWTR